MAIIDQRGSHSRDKGHHGAFKAEPFVLPARLKRTEQSLPHNDDFAAWSESPRLRHLESKGPSNRPLNQASVAMQSPVPPLIDFIDLTTYEPQPNLPSDDSAGLYFQDEDLFYGDDDDLLWNEIFPFPEFLPASPGPERKRRVINPSSRPATEAIIDTPTESPAPNPFPVTVNPAIDPPCGPAQIDTRSEDAFGKILEIFPDISQDHVRTLITKHQESSVIKQTTNDIVEAITEDVLAKLPYPKQKDLKRKRKTSEAEDSDTSWRDYKRSDPSYSQQAIKVLMREFPLVPFHHIRYLVDTHKTLFAAYIAIYASEHLSDRDARAPYDRLRKARKVVSAVHYSDRDSEREMGHELKAAIQAATKEAKARRRLEEIDEAEKRNEEEHTKLGALVECQCCFADTPTNRAISCEGTDIHFFCYKCIKNSAESQIGLMKYEMKCFDTSGCRARFSRESLSRAVGQPMMTKLESLQQQDEIAKAGLEGLEDCPFCEFKAVCPPCDEDREFRCLNPDCEKVSCRLCKQETHIPKSCGEARKEAGLPERHLVEEAMTEALIRTCPKCKVKIIKEWGCNKMVCVKCGCSMCYICKKDITRFGYHHFKEGPGGCQVYDQGGDRHQDEVNRAQHDTIKKITAENPHINQDELRVNHSLETKKTDTRRQVHHVPVIIPPPPVVAGGAPVNLGPVLPQHPVPYPRPMLTRDIPTGPVRPFERMNFVPMLGDLDPQLGAAPHRLGNRHLTRPIREDMPNNAAHLLPPDIQTGNNGQYHPHRPDYNHDLFHTFHHRMNAFQVPSQTLPLPPRYRMMNLDQIDMV